VYDSVEYAGTELKIHTYAFDKATSPSSVNQQTAVTEVSVTTASDDTRLASLTCAVTSGGACNIQCGLGPASSGACASSDGGFDPDVRAYRIFVGEDEEQIRFTPTALEVRATLDVNGTAIVDNQLSGWFDLGFGLNTFMMQLTAEDVYVQESYTILVDRAYSGAATNPTLANLTIVDQLTGVEASYGFKPQAGPSNYSLAIDASVSSINVTANPFYPSDVTVTLFWDGGGGLDLSNGAVGVVDLSSLREKPSIRDPLHLDVVASVGTGTQQISAVYGLRVVRHGPGACTDRTFCAEWHPQTPVARAIESYPGLVGPYAGVLPTLDTAGPEWINYEVAYTTLLVSPFTQTQKKTDTTATIAAQLSEQGTVYYVVVADGTSVVPTAREIREANYQGTTVASGSYSSSPYKLTEPGAEFTISGLTASTAYDIYLVASDDAQDLQLEAKANLGSVVKIDVTTDA